MKFPERFRVICGHGVYNSREGERFGAFKIPARASGGRELLVIAAEACAEIPEASDWEHVSVSVIGQANKCPGWAEMCAVKALFWDEEECVVEFHPAKSEYVNHHAGCLHLWRYVGPGGFPVPNSILVGPHAGEKSGTARRSVPTVEAARVQQSTVDLLHRLLDLVKTQQMPAALRLLHETLEKVHGDGASMVEAARIVFLANHPVPECPGAFAHWEGCVSNPVPVSEKEGA